MLIEERKFPIHFCIELYIFGAVHI